MYMVHHVWNALLVGIAFLDTCRRIHHHSIPLVTLCWFGTRPRTNAYNVVEDLWPNQRPQKEQWWKLTQTTTATRLDWMRARCPGFPWQIWHPKPEKWSKSVRSKPEKVFLPINVTYGVHVFLLLWQSSSLITLLIVTWYNFALEAYNWILEKGI